MKGIIVGYLIGLISAYCIMNIINIIRYRNRKEIRVTSREELEEALKMIAKDLEDRNASNNK